MLESIVRKIHYWVFPSKKQEEIKPVDNENVKIVEDAVDKAFKKSANKRKASKTNVRHIYLYFTAFDKRYFKTRKGKNGIPVTASEALIIVSSCRKGIPKKEIYNKIDWEHEISEYSFYNWIRKYNAGLMDIALAWICDNHVDDICVNKKEVLHKFVGDI
ncbi:MAG: hypothetical protein Q4P18_07085 [Methanobrevibacter sp.]|uniref:hypothetical protein n=1 Tax=Methanobrevibacter sp. TaxID=66852 RepID=UPI0026E07863|nr:hypothetical protein [Methanobrevibacter sp.]MDO5849281.1 hypothetical protein [Methanobrevibacter sp.]